jgi:hypothetical protein
MSCIKQQYGGCGAHFVKGVGIVLDEPNAIIADPSFVDMDNDDYHLSVPSQFLGADGTQRGCYGGEYPIDW